MGAELTSAFWKVPLRSVDWAKAGRGDVEMLIGEVLGKEEVLYPFIQESDLHFGSVTGYRLLGPRYSRRLGLQIIIP